MWFFIDFAEDVFRLTCEKCGEVLFKDANMTEEFAVKAANVHAVMSHDAIRHGSAHIAKAGDDENPHRRVITLSVETKPVEAVTDAQDDTEAGGKGGTEDDEEMEEGGDADADKVQD